MKDKNIKQIISSPLKRTQETAQIISRITNVSVQTDERLKERLNWGDNPNQSFDDFLQEWQQTTIDRNYQPSAGDSSLNAGERLKKVLIELSATNIGKNIVLVTHGGVIADLLRSLFSEEYIKTFYPDFLQIGLLECSITHIIEYEGKYELKAVNFVKHLPQPIQ